MCRGDGYLDFPMVRGEEREFSVFRHEVHLPVGNVSVAFWENFYFSFSFIYFKQLLLFLFSNNNNVPTSHPYQISRVNH